MKFKTVCKVIELTMIACRHRLWGCELSISHVARRRRVRRIVPRALITCPFYRDAGLSSHCMQLGEPALHRDGLGHASWMLLKIKTKLKVRKTWSFQSIDENSLIWYRKNLSLQNILTFLNIETAMFRSYQYSFIVILVSDWFVFHRFMKKDR